MRFPGHLTISTNLYMTLSHSRKFPMKKAPRLCPGTRKGRGGNGKIREKRRPILASSLHTLAGWRVHLCPRSRRLYLVGSDEFLCPSQNLVAQFRLFCQKLAKISLEFSTVVVSDIYLTINVRCSAVKALDFSKVNNQIPRKQQEWVAPYTQIFFTGRA